MSAIRSMHDKGSPTRLELLILVAMIAATGAVILALPSAVLGMPVALPDQAWVDNGGNAVHDLPPADVSNLAPPILDNGGSFTIPVCISITYQGHGPAGTPRWTLPVNIKYYTATTNNLIGECTPTTSAQGGACCVLTLWGAVNADIEVKHSHTLSNKKFNVPLQQGPAIYVPMGQLREGDANNSNSVTLLDFSILRTTYGLACPPCDKRADFNEDNTISILDFSLLRSNYARSGPIVVVGTVPQAQGVAALSPDGVMLRLVPGSIVVKPGAVVPVDIVLDAGAQSVDGADIYLDFDPRYLIIVDEQGNPATAVTPGTAFPDLLQNSVDNERGQINFSAGILTGDQPRGTVVMARFYVSQRASPYGGWTTISFSRQAPRQTEVAYDGESILGGTSNGYVNAPSLRLWLPWAVKNLPLPLPLPMPGR